MAPEVPELVGAGVKDPFVSDQEAGYFWRTNVLDDVEVQFSNRPHELLPHHCAEHDWYTDKPCPAPHGMKERSVLINIVRIALLDGATEVEVNELLREHGYSENDIFEAAMRSLQDEREVYA